MGEYVLVLVDQKLVQIRIGACDCGTKNRARKRHLIDFGTKFDFAAEKTTHPGGQASSMDKAHVIWSQTEFGYFPTCPNKCSKREFNLVPIQPSRNANSLQNYINFSPFADRHSETFIRVIPPSALGTASKCSAAELRIDPCNHISAKTG